MPVTVRMNSKQPSQGFTLAEALIVIALIGVLALALVPLASSQNPAKLNVAATEIGNALRLAISEAERTGGYVLVDGSDPGRVRMFHSDASGANLGSVTDPLTKRTLDVDASAPALPGKVTMTPKFFKGSTAYRQLLIGPGTLLQAFDNGNNKGALDAGSGVVLTSDGQSVTVGLNEITGLVTIP
jgi:prepilin-type N-terminal cleavage/methylation domain-containing protein